MSVQDYDLGYYEGVRNILQMVLRMNHNTSALLEAIKLELEDAKDCLNDSKKDEDYQMELDNIEQNPHGMG